MPYNYARGRSLENRRESDKVRKKQISNLEDAYVVKDTIEYVFDNQVPLWMFGFLY